MQQITHNNTLTYQTPQTAVSHTTWLEVDARAFEHNAQLYKSVVQPAELAPVIKSNAYGHGIELMASLCQISSAVDRICVVSLAEAVHLRTLGITKPIIVLSILDADLELAAIHDIAVVLYDMETALQLNEIGKKHGKKTNVHVKIDTGLSRLGILAHHALPQIKAFYSLPFVGMQGIFTHFAESENADQTFTNQQINTFTQLLDALEEHNIHIPLKHSSCSAAITGNARSNLTLNRAGLGLYGLWPSLENKIMAQSHFPHFSLKPVLTWKTRVIQVKEVPAYSYIGYDRTHQVIRNSKLAILPVGYWDGYDRALSNKGTILIHNKLAPVIGRIAMNMMMVDITDIPHVAMHDEVTLLGNHAGITADDLATHAGTINYEIVTRINPLLPRIIVP